ncbi:MAG: hypothetical protein QNL61_02970 [Crocinitomicaceae bacterium]
MMESMMLNSPDDLTADLLESGVVSWDDIVRSVQCFHYDRNSDRNDLNLVWYERKGSCSSKHAFLKHVADLNNLPDIELVLAFYKMNAKNTPVLGEVLEKNNLTEIPEAYCYLKVNGVELDVTTVHSDFKQYKKDIISTKSIEPKDVISNKIEWHKLYLEEWRKEKHPELDFDTLWSIREACIAQLGVRS